MLIEMIETAPRYWEAQEIVHRRHWHARLLRTGSIVVFYSAIFAVLWATDFK